MFDLYHAIFFLHILAACTWLGGGIVMEALHLRLGGHPTLAQLREFFSMAHWVSPRIFMPAALTTLLSGLLLVYVGGAAWQDGWIKIALAGVAVTVALGATLIGPTVARLFQLTQQGADLAALEPSMRKLAIVTRLDLVIILLILLDMVIQPAL